MPALLQRKVELTLSRPGAGPSFFALDQTNAVQVTDLRVTFSVEKTIGSSPNTAQVVVYNLAEITRAEFIRKPLHVRLEAGYEGDLARLFTGDLSYGSNVPEGVDWRTELTLGDGARAYRNARARASLAAGSTRRQALAACASALGLALPRSVDDVPEIAAALRVQYASGVALSGPARQELDRVCRAAGVSWSIQDGRLQILRDADTRSDEIARIAADTGMVGSPEMGAPERASAAGAGKGGRRSPRLTVRTLLDPRITPGGRVRVESLAYTGLIRAVKVVHTGDTHGQDWYTVVEGTPL